jgi:hypothetical protein
VCDRIGGTPNCNIEVIRPNSCIQLYCSQILLLKLHQIEPLSMEFTIGLCQSKFKGTS